MNGNNRPKVDINYMIKYLHKRHDKPKIRGILLTVLPKNKVPSAKVSVKIAI
jgi:hypothetical protein